MVNPATDSVPNDSGMPSGSPLRPLVRPTGAFELKFLVPDELAAQVLELARTQLAPDPHAGREHGDQYHVSSSYFDTSKLDVYHRVGKTGRRKFRIRRYGAESSCFLERKTKSHGLVYKRRTKVDDSELLREWNVSEPGGWTGDWFRRRIIGQSLAPTVQVTYERVARVGMTPEGPIRLTIDRRIQCQCAEELLPPHQLSFPPILNGMRIVEFKYRISVPAIFKQLITELALRPTLVSKYRLSIEALNLVPTRDSNSAHSESGPTEVPFSGSAACG